MSRIRLISIAVGILVALGLVAGLFDSLQRLYAGLAVISPLLASLLLILLVAAVIAALAALAYYLILFGRPKSQQQTPSVSLDRTEAAQENLQAVRQQVVQIQDEIARQALLEQSRVIEQDLSQRDLQVVVFGVGSAGKTSLVNAILGQIVGEVAAPMGTTTTGDQSDYRLRLRGTSREIVIIDTPGIQEAGIAGSQREQATRQIAIDADLLLFVIDNDLRQSEAQLLQMLSEIGKRLLVVLNKTDLYLDSERQQILERLYQRLPILSEDLVAVAANPRPLTLPDGKQIQPEPEILPLLLRMAAVLRTEGEDLVADNILLRSQRLGEETRRLIDAQRQRQAEQIVERFQWIGAGVVAATPLPVVDLLATAAINAQMVVELGRVYDCEMNLERGKELALSLAKTLVSLGVVRGAIELFSVALQTNIGTFLVGRAVQGVTAAYLTRIAGRSFIEYFRQNQNWGDGGISEVVQEQFCLNRRDEFVKTFVQEALVRVVRPLTTL